MRGREEERKGGRDGEREGGGGRIGREKRCFIPSCLCKQTGSLVI